MAARSAAGRPGPSYGWQEGDALQRCEKIELRRAELQELLSIGNDEGGILASHLPSQRENHLCDDASRRDCSAHARVERAHPRKGLA
jgi:hypothetical protein